VRCATDLAGSNIHRQELAQVAFGFRMFVIRSSYRARAPSAQNPLRTRAKMAFSQFSVSGTYSAFVWGLKAIARQLLNPDVLGHISTSIPTRGILPGIYTTLPVSELSWTMVWYPSPWHE